MVREDKSVFYGISAGFGLLVFYLTVLTLFQGLDFALLNFKNLWFWILPLAGGFGVQVGLYNSIKHTCNVAGTVAGTGSVAGGSMIVCCSHFLLNLIPIVGFSGISVFLMNYQKWFFAFGILANLVGIGMMVNHKNKMEGKIKDERR